MAGERTLANILSQHEAWAALADEWPQHARALPPFSAADRLIFTGCGSAWFASQALAFTASDLLGLPAQAIPSSEIALYPDVVCPGYGRALLIALSRSGQTSETLEATQAFRGMTHGSVWALTSVPDSDLARAADGLMDASAGDEQGIVQTRSISTLLLFGLAALAESAGQPAGDMLDRLPEAARATLEAAQPLAEQFGGDHHIERFFFLGSGPWRGIASEAMLKIKEMSHAQSESFHTLEFRHGLGANADGQSLVVGFLSDRAARAERAVLSEFQSAQGVQALSIGVGATLASGSSFALDLPADLPEWARLPLALPFAQIMGVTRARLNGLNPDEPQNLKSFIALEGPLV
ncbi:MAG: SIS domain-containing protein [Anaerolineae bacterium]